MPERRWVWIPLLALASQGCFGSTEFDRSKAEKESPCNDLEALDVQPACVALDEVPAPTGGQIADGLYALVAYSTPPCNFGLKRTSRITRVSDDTYELELLVEHYGPQNATFVTSGTTITSTYTCGGGEDPPLEYAVSDEPEAYRFIIVDGSSALIYQRFGD